MAATLALGLLALASGAAATCPYPTNGADGCPGAPANGSFIRPAPFTNYARQSGQTWANPHPWAWNAPGVDYAVGYSTTTKLQDPATASLPHGCAYQPTGSVSGGAIVFCDRYNGVPIDSPTIQNIDFSLHNCTVLLFSAYVTGTVTVTNNNFKNGSNCAVPAGAMVRLAGGNANFVFQNNQVDGNWPKYIVPLADDVKDNSGTGYATFEYNVFISSPQRPINVSSMGNVLLAFNYSEGWILNKKLQEHGEILLQVLPPNASVNSTVFSYNTAVVPATAPQLGPSPFVVTGNPGAHDYFVNASIDHNVVVINKSGGATGSYALEAALSMINWGLYGNVTFLDNYVDPTGARACIVDAGGVIGVTGSMMGNTLTVTHIGAGALYPGAKFEATGVLPQVVLPYGSVDPLTGNASTGTGGLGTYVLAGPAQTAAFTDGATISSPIAKVNIGGNVSLVTGSPITGIGGRPLGAACPPLF